MFTLPRLSELDSQAQGRLQAFVEMTGKEPGEYVSAKWKRMDPDRSGDTGKIYKKYPRRVRDGVKERITTVRFTPPSPELIEPYEERKATFQREFYRKTIETLNGNDPDSDEDDGEMDVHDIAEAIAESDDWEETYVKSNNGQKYIDKDMIELDYDIGARRSKKVKKLLQRDTDVEAL